jgi:hypothetical protein
MSRRSESVKRTVVAVSFSFFMTVDFCINYDRPSLPKSREDAYRYLIDISEISHCEQYLVSIASQPQKAMYKILDAERAFLPQMQVVCHRSQGWSNLRVDGPPCSPPGRK